MQHNRPVTIPSLTHFAQSSKMETEVTGFDARLAKRLSGTLALNSERQSARKSKTKNVQLTSLTSNTRISVPILGTLS